MVTALTIANTILVRATVEGMEVRHMKLQKLTYILYKEYLQQTGNPLFGERFEVWKYGPVLRSVYEVYGRFGSNVIPVVASNSNCVYVVNLQKSAELKDIFEKFWNTYKDYAGTYLAKLTYAKNTAWRKAADAHQIFLSDEDIRWEKPFRVDHINNLTN